MISPVGNRHQVARAGRSTTGRASSCPFVQLERAADASAEYVSLRACQLPAGEVVVRRQQNAGFSPLDLGGRALPSLDGRCIIESVVGMLHGGLSSDCNQPQYTPLSRPSLQPHREPFIRPRRRASTSAAKSSGGAVETRTSLLATQQRISRVHLHSSTQTSCVRLPAWSLPYGR